MRALILRVIMLLAVLAMPLGMGAPAAATGAHHMAASGAMNHRPDDIQKSEGAAGFEQCTMACSAALPAIEAPAPNAPLLPTVRHALPQAELVGLAPDIATPPPKLSLSSRREI